jgi:DNA-binding beta-propeller fold protein YncE
MPARDDIKSVLINGLRYPLAAPVERSQLGIFARKFIVGDAQFDSDDYLSAWIISNLSGGIGIEDSDEGADTTRFWFGIMDTRSPRMIGLPPLVHEPTSPQAGAAYPIGVVGTQFYMCFDDDVYGWDDDNNTWYATANGIVDVPVGKSVAFDGRVFIPQGANGHTFVTEATPGTGTLTDAQETTPEAVSFAIWNNKLYALATDGDLWVLTVGQDPATDWTTVQDSAGTTVKINTSETPKNLVTYFNRQGEPTLWAITDRAAYMFYEAAREWRQSNIVFPPHPDFGRSAAVWRTGEDLWIAAGMDVVRQTTGNAIVPLGSGLSRDQGVPQEYRGAIVDLQPEISHLYALVGGTPSTQTSYAYNAQFITDGTGDDNASSPKQIAIDLAGDIYIADFDNDRVKRHSSAGTFEANLVTSLDEVTGVCVDNTLNNVYVSYKHGASDYRVRKYNSAGALGWTSSLIADDGLGHLATDSTHVYVTLLSGINGVSKRLCSDGSFVTAFGANGSGDGELSAPYGIAYSSTTGTLYVADTGNDRVQEFTTAGVFVRKWGSSGTGNGQFMNATGIAIGPDGTVFVADSGRDDVQQFTSSGTFLRKFGTAGSGNGQFAAADGIAVESDGDVWVTDTQSASSCRIQKFVATTAASANSTSYPSLHAWPGTGWHGLWHLEDTSIAPTWMSVSATADHYRLWWGDSAGQAYWMKLFRGFENPNQARIAGSAEFAEEGFLLSSKFDAGMLGFHKVASHVVVIPIEGSLANELNGNPAEFFTVEFSIDDGGWETLGVVDADAVSGGNDAHFSFGSAGRVFNTIRFRISGDRGSTTSRSPFLRSLTLLFVKVPQEATSLVFTIVPPENDRGGFGNRTGQTMFAELEALASAKTFFDVSYNGLTFEHCRFAGATGQDNISGNAGKRVVNVIVLPTGT